MDVSGQFHAPADLPWKETQIPEEFRLGFAPEVLKTRISYRCWDSNSGFIVQSLLRIHYAGKPRKHSHTQTHTNIYMCVYVY